MNFRNVIFRSSVAGVIGGVLGLLRGTTVDLPGWLAGVGISVGCFAGTFVNLLIRPQVVQRGNAKYWLMWVATGAIGGAAALLGILAFHRPTDIEAAGTIIVFVIGALGIGFHEWWWFVGSEKNNR